MHIASLSITHILWSSWSTSFMIAERTFPYIRHNVGNLGMAFFVSVKWSFRIFIIHILEITFRKKKITISKKDIMHYQIGWERKIVLEGRLGLLF